MELFFSVLAWLLLVGGVLFFLVCILVWACVYAVIRRVNYVSTEPAYETVDELHYCFPNHAVYPFKTMPSHVPMGEP